MRSKKKNHLSEGGVQPKMSGGMIGGGAPGLKKRVNPKISGYTGGMTDYADNLFGGVMGMGRNFPVDYFDDMELDELDELDEEILQEISLSDVGSFISKNLGKAGNLVKSGLYSIPIFGDLASALSFLWHYFGPYGLRVSVRKFTRKLSKLSGVDLGDDFLEAENISDNTSEKMSEKGFTDRVSYAIYKLSHPSQFPDVAKRVDPDEIIALLDDYDAILDDLRKSSMAFFGAVDIFFKQAGLGLNVALSVIEPEDTANWLANVYAKEMMHKVKRFIPNKSSMRNLFKLPDALGHYDLFINGEKLQRFAAVNNGLKELKTRGEKELAAKGEEASLAGKILRFVVDKIFEEKTPQTLLEVMSEYLDEDIDDEHAEEYEIDEFSGAGGVGGAALPLGKMHRVGAPDYTDKDRKKFYKHAAKSMGITTEAVMHNQNWHHKTTGKIKFK